MDKKEEINAEEIYKSALALWGKSQIGMATEECGEFITAVNKLARSTNEGFDEMRYKLCSEIADVQIMMEQMAIMFGKEDVEYWKNFKLERLKFRISQSQK